MTNVVMRSALLLTRICQSSRYVQRLSRPSSSSRVVMIDLFSRVKKNCCSSLVNRRSFNDGRSSSSLSVEEVSKTTASRQRILPDDGLTLQDFVSSSSLTTKQEQSGAAPAMWQPAAIATAVSEQQRSYSFHIKTYGCQMNVNDSEIVRSLLLNAGFVEKVDSDSADVWLTNTCAIREGAEQKVWTRLQQLRAVKRKDKRKQKEVVVGVLGCMAERLQNDLLQKNMADLVVGPDAYRHVPQLLTDLLTKTNRQQLDTAMNVQLSTDETYADITPVREPDSDSVSAFVSIQRGCSNRCSFCIVPFTRGGIERSRPMESILSEIQRLHFEMGIKEVTLLGQNVNSYHDRHSLATATPYPAIHSSSYKMSNAGFHSRIRRPSGGYFFADLLEAVANIAPDQLRVRFTSPHPKDYPQHLLQLMAERPNICNHLHMPAQSGSTSVLKRMKRGYSRDAYLQLMDDVHATIQDVAVSSDFIAGFCDETEDEHFETISLLELVQYDQAYMFAYSMREKTHAARTLPDNVSAAVKQRRLQEIIDVYQRIVHQKNVQQEEGRLRLVLIEGESKRSQPGAQTWHGRTDQNKRITFPVEDDDNNNNNSDDYISVPCWNEEDVRPILDSVKTAGGSLHCNLDKDKSYNFANNRLRKGDYAVVQVTKARGPALRGKLLWRSDSITSFEETGLSGKDEESLQRASDVLSLLQVDEPTPNIMAFSDV